jgi:hypothetical protein
VHVAATSELRLAQTMLVFAVRDYRFHNRAPTSELAPRMTRL